VAKLQLQLWLVAGVPRQLHALACATERKTGELPVRGADNAECKPEKQQMQRRLGGAVRWAV